MALLASNLAPVGGGASTTADKSATLATVTSTAEIALAAFQYFALNASGDINIRFGQPGMPAAAATDFRIPAGTTVIYPVTKQNPSIRLFNATGGTITYYIQPLCAQI